jgi:hypothetical protein
MTLNYQKIWDSMNSLEAASSKICSAREILDSAIISLESGNREKTETLMYAVDEFLQYYLEDFDRKFKDAWDETVVKLKQEERDDYMRPWGHSAMEALRYTDSEMDAMCDNAAKEDKVVRWQLPVEEVKDSDTDETEYFITLPDDLLEAANLSPGDEVEWVEQEVGTFLLRKIEKTLNHDEAIAAGWTMTDDGFWVKE